MEVLRSAWPSRLGTWRWQALAAVLGVLAYRPLLAGSLELPSASSVDQWLFRPSALPALLVLLAAAWLTWRRRERLAALPLRSAPWIAAVLALLAGACFVWALRTRAADLLFPSLSLHLLAFAAAARGLPGCRVLALPALLLLLGVRIPVPLLDELVWHLQLSTAAGSAWLLALIGHDFVQGGVMLRNDEHSFHVIDGCSGLQGIQILLLIALLIREVFAHSGARQWLLVLLAPGLGFALNLLRISYVAASSNPEALAGMHGDHTALGVAVLAAGTAILYGLGLAMEGNAEALRGPSESKTSEPRSAWGAPVAWLAVLALLSLVVTPFVRDSSGVADEIRISESGSRWTSEPADIDPFFIGALPAKRRLHRRFELAEQPPQIVEIFVGQETAESPESSKLLSSKLQRPGPGWDLVRSQRERHWMLDDDIVVSVASQPPGNQHAVVYSWRLRDRGLWRESWRSLLALDETSFGRRRARTVVRLLTYAPHDGPLAFDRAKQRLDAFVSLFHEELAAL